MIWTSPNKEQAGNGKGKQILHQPPSLHSLHVKILKPQNGTNPPRIWTLIGKSSTTNPSTTPPTKSPNHRTNQRILGQGFPRSRIFANNSVKTTNNANNKTNQHTPAQQAETTPRPLCRCRGAPWSCGYTAPTSDRPPWTSPHGRLYSLTLWNWYKTRLKAKRPTNRTSKSLRSRKCGGMPNLSAE